MTGRSHEATTGIELYSTRNDWESLPKHLETACREGDRMLDAMASAALFRIEARSQSAAAEAVEKTQDPDQKNRLAQVLNIQSSAFPHDRRIVVYGENKWVNYSAYLLDLAADQEDNARLSKRNIARSHRDFNDQPTVN